MGRAGRCFKGAIQRHLEDALAKRLLAGDFAPGETIFVGQSGSELTFAKGGGEGDRPQKASVLS